MNTKRITKKRPTKLTKAIKRKFSVTQPPPTKPCPTCRDTTFWWAPGNTVWVCKTCHPPHGRKQVLWLQVKPRPETTRFPSPK